jgi:hypothetical protein
MYIAPNSTIKILRNVPLDPTYEHTIYFPVGDTGLATQRAYFSAKAKYTFTEQTYQRVNKGRIRLAALADNLYDCNYLMFQNTNFGSKWFYAFIKSVEYINNAVCEVEYEIDVIQTWNNDYLLDVCYVERQHTETDEIGDNIINEEFNIGDYVCNANTYLDMNDMNIAVISTPKDSGGQLIPINNGHIYYNVYAGYSVSTIFHVNQTDMTSLNSYIAQLVANNEQIIAMYQFPSIFSSAIEGVSQTVEHTMDKNTVAIDGYIPKNNKLFTYPYNVLRVDDNNGRTQDYKYEYFAGDIMCFEFKCCILPSPVVVGYPLGYKGMTEYYPDRIITENFPVCSWSTDSFQQWFANNRAAITLDTTLNALTLMMKMRNNSPNVNESIGEMWSYAYNVHKSALTAAQKPNLVSGNTSSSNLNAAISKQRIDFYALSINSQVAKVIDDYFNRYGYAIKRNMIPNRCTRPYWTYVKTIGCTLSGSVPADDISKICSIYDHGITFWKNASLVGDYTQDNRPVVNP